MGGGEVLRRGWLIKSPPLDSGGIKNWRKRFFKLRSSKILEYYKSESGDLKGVINLEDCKAVNSDLFHKKYKYVFGIETHDRVYYLVASSAEEMTGWVDILCTMCGFILRTSPTPPDQAQSSKTMVNPRNSKIDAVISPPVSTLPHNVSGSLLNENFNPEEPQSDLYSLATATIYDVQTKSTEVPSGIPLSDALAAKGMTASPISSVYSQATPLPESAYFSPRSQDASALYAVPQKKTKLPKQHSVDAAAPDKETSPRHRPLSGTQSDAAVMRLSSQEAPGYRPAETMSNGYMRPSQWLNNPRPSNYDYVTGPPRPADGATPPHRSPLQSEDSDQVASVHEDSGSHTYINVKELHDEIRQIEAPPQIDRSNKPPKPVPPTVDRGLKPGTRVSKSQTEDSDFSDSTPNFPTRTGSMSTSTPPVVDSSDLPRPTRRTMKYAHVEFDSTGQLNVVDGLAQSTPTDVSKRAPVPIPRGQNKKRVNYCQIDIAATQAMEGSSGVETQMSLNEAEAAALAEKPYVNVARDGHIDDDTDPDYYTHMRNLPSDSLFYAVMSKRGEDNEDFYQEPSEAMNN